MTSTQAKANDEPITTSIFDLFKIGPGPSSSHTIGPMKAGLDFLAELDQAFVGTRLRNFCRSDAKEKVLPHQDPVQDPERSVTVLSPISTHPAEDPGTPSTVAGDDIDDLYPSVGLEIHLFGSLSATGKGHGTDIAATAGLLGWHPKSCDPEALRNLMAPDAPKFYRIPTSVSGLPKSEAAPSHQQWNPYSQLSVGSDCIVWHSADQSAQPEACGLHDSCPLSQSPSNPSLCPERRSAGDRELYHPNTMIIILKSFTGEILLEREYYSVGGGFIQKKGCLPEGVRLNVQLPYPYRRFRDIKQILEKNPTLTLPAVLMANEMAITGMTEKCIRDELKEIISVMMAAVDRGLSAEGVLPGDLRLHRKARRTYERARSSAMRADDFMMFLNAYCLAASEENAQGNQVVTAPTSGASGVFPGLIYFMKKHLFYSDDHICDGLMVAGLVGFLVKRHASISGAEMGCMGEVGTASGMGAAMLSYCSYLTLDEIEAAAEIAIEHHLGLTCDPIGGYVQIPCIQRNPMGAIKSYNAYLLASGCDPKLQAISLDRVIQVMKQTGEDMSFKYKETGFAGLASSRPDC